VFEQPVQQLAIGWVVWSSSPGEGEIFCSYPHWLQGKPSLLYNGYWGSFPWAKWPGCDVDHPPSSSSTKVKEWVEVYLYSLSLACYRVNFTFYFICLLPKILMGSDIVNF
jgi:hypothetical protein